MGCKCSGWFAFETVCGCPASFPAVCFYILWGCTVNDFNAFPLPIIWSWSAVCYLYVEIFFWSRGVFKSSLWTAEQYRDKLQKIAFGHIYELHPTHCLISRASTTWISVVEKGGVPLHQGQWQLEHNWLCCLLPIHVSSYTAFVLIQW